MVHAAPSTSFYNQMDDMFGLFRLLQSRGLLGDDATLQDDWQDPSLTLDAVPGLPTPQPQNGAQHVAHDVRVHLVGPTSQGTADLARELFPTVSAVEFGMPPAGTCLDSVLVGPPSGHLVGLSGSSHGGMDGATTELLGQAAASPHCDALCKFRRHLVRVLVGSRAAHDLQGLATDASRFWNKDGSKPVVVSVIRRGDSARGIVNEAEVLQALTSQLPEGSTVQPLVLGSSDRSRADDAAELWRTDVLVGVHGAGLVNMLLLRPGSAVVELFPQGFDRDTYERLAATLGLHYVSYTPTATATPPAGDSTGDNGALQRARVDAALAAVPPEVLATWDAAERDAITASGSHRTTTEQRAECASLAQRDCDWVTWAGNQFWINQPVRVDTRVLVHEIKAAIRQGQHVGASLATQRMHAMRHAAGNATLPTLSRATGKSPAFPRGDGDDAHNRPTTMKASLLMLGACLVGLVACVYFGRKPFADFVDGIEAGMESAENKEKRV